MPQLIISEVAKRVGLRPSAIRYYERVGILPPALRTSGQRRYDTGVLYRLAVIQRARQTGFTLEEIRELFFGFRADTSPGKRWQKMAQRKLIELDTTIEQIKTMRQLLVRMQECKCDAMDQCGKAILEKGCSPQVANNLATVRRVKRRTIQ